MGGTTARGALIFGRQVISLALASAALAAAAPAAGANDKYEPNDNFAQPGTTIAGGQRYDAMIDGLGDDDYFILRGSGQVTVDVAVTADSCPDSAYALSVQLRDYDTAFSSSNVDTHIQQVGTTQFTATLQKGKQYRLGFRSESTNHSDPPCGATRVDYNFTVTGAVEGTEPSTKPTKLKTRPAFRTWTCYRQSTAHTGGAAALVFTLKKNGNWVDRFTKVTSKWTWKKNKLTLLTKKGKRLHAFTHMQDAASLGGEKFLKETPEPKNKDSLICR